MLSSSGLTRGTSRPREVTRDSQQQMIM